MALPSSKLASDDLLQAQALIWNHILSFMRSCSLKCAVQLEIPDIIQKHGKPMSLSDLVDALPINKAKAGCVRRLMRLLVDSGFFLESSDGYELKPAARLLVRDHPFSMTPFLRASLDETFLTGPCHQLSNWFKDDDLATTPFVRFHGREVFEFVAEQPEMNELFNGAMASDSKLVSSLVISRRDCRQVFEGMDSMVDVGGGTGTMARAIASEFPLMSCVVLDLPHVLDGLEGSSRGNNVRFVSGDMFEFVPPADCILLKWILHCWSDDKCVKILRNCKEAIVGNETKRCNKVIIIDMVVDSKNKGDSEFETQLFFDMLMMSATGGHERTEKDWSKLFIDAGFKEYKITPLLGLRSLIEVYP